MIKLTKSISFAGVGPMMSSSWCIHCQFQTVVDIQWEFSSEKIVGLQNDTTCSMQILTWCVILAQRARTLQLC